MPQRPDTLLLPALATAYGSADRARVALAGALTHADLDDLPCSPSEVASFVAAHLSLFVERDLGGFIGTAVTEQLLALVKHAALHSLYA